MSYTWAILRNSQESESMGQPARHSDASSFLVKDSVQPWQEGLGFRGIGFQDLGFRALRV